eukprot:CAMPEP_0198525096 /NCGR_PEP_ID=MMETSP1462-20131121/23139_1 /TAXON_ID=1333877 /ORGANISM="Brandtodinium nutriculum, Strain RCC3387" /LENGTH=79 /DNA_ID=CAMNT_0044254839 /DNA_START=139 /DNA_END=374 /DNA_ORIENTATION=-
MQLGDLPQLAQFLDGSRSHGFLDQFLLTAIATIRVVEHVPNLFAEQVPCSAGLPAPRVGEGALDLAVDALATLDAARCP